MAYEVEWISDHTKTKACIPSTVISDVNTQLLIEKQSAALSLAMKKTQGKGLLTRYVFCRPGVSRSWTLSAGQAGLRMRPLLLR